MEREACVCDHGFERSDLCAEIIIIITRDVEIESIRINKVSVSIPPKAKNSRLCELRIDCLIEDG